MSCFTRLPTISAMVAVAAAAAVHPGPALLFGSTAHLLLQGKKNRLISEMKFTASPTGEKPEKHQSHEDERKA